jgi:hypothetical protein
VTRLRPLSEEECYARLYGKRDSAVAVLRESDPERPSGGRLGEQLRQLFRERMEADGPDGVSEVEAA